MSDRRRSETEGKAGKETAEEDPKEDPSDETSGFDTVCR